MRQPHAPGHVPEPKNWYQIRVEGHLDAHWDDWFEGLTVTNRADGTSTLSGVLSDQAELHGVLRRIGALGLTLVSVNPTGSDEAL